LNFIPEEHLDQIETMLIHGEEHDVVLLDHGRHAPINLVVFQCVDMVECFGTWDEEFTYYAAEIESWNWDGDVGDDIYIEDVVDKLYKVEKTPVATYEWKRV